MNDDIEIIRTCLFSDPEPEEALAALKRIEAERDSLRNQLDVSEACNTTKTEMIFTLREKLEKVVEKFTKEATVSKEAALKLLIKEGILTKEGNLSKNYRVP